MHHVLTALFVIVFPVTVLAWILFGVGYAAVTVLDSDKPSPPPVRAVPLPDGWVVVEERDCTATSCRTRIVTVDVPATGEPGPPALRLQRMLVEAGWAVKADAPSIVESDEGVRVDTSALATEAVPPPAAGTPAPTVDPNDPTATIADPAAPTTAAPTTVAPTTEAPTTVAADPNAPTTTPASTIVDGAATPTTLSPADALRRTTFALGFRDDATAKSYHREGLATYHVRGMHQILVLLTMSTIGLGVALWILDQFVS